MKPALQIDGIVQSPKPDVLNPRVNLVKSPQAGPQKTHLFAAVFCGPDEMETSPSLCFLQPGPQTAWGQLGPLQLPGTEKCKGLNKNYIGYLGTIGYHTLWSLANNSLLLFFFLLMPE